MVCLKYRCCLDVFLFCLQCFLFFFHLTEFHSREIICCSQLQLTMQHTKLLPTTQGWLKSSLQKLGFSQSIAILFAQQKTRFGFKMSQKNLRCTFLCYLFQLFTQWHLINSGEIPVTLVVDKTLQVLQYFKTVQLCNCNFAMGLYNQVKDTDLLKLKELEFHKQLKINYFRLIFHYFLIVFFVGLVFSDTLEAGSNKNITGKAVFAFFQHI